MNLALPGFFLAGLAFGLPLGQLRAGAERFLHRRFGLLASSALLALGFYLARMIGFLLVRRMAGDLIHNAVYILIDGQGKLRTEFHGLFTPTEEIVGAIRGLLPANNGKTRRL